ncbi:MAG: V-type ATPase subunit [Clostridiaceae bacterium]
MGSIVKFSAVNSKVKTLKGRMLNEEQYNQLLESKDYKSSIRVLKERTEYRGLLSKYDLDKIHRGDLEVILNRQYTSIYNKFIKYFNGEYRKFIRLLYLRWEIEDLKIIIRCKYIGRSKEEIKESLIAQNPLNTLDYSYLIDAKSLEDLSDRLKGSIYYDSIKNHIKDISHKGLFRIETELDFVYFQSIKKELKNLDKENSKVIDEITGLEIDLINLSWMYRGRNFFRIVPEELFNYTIYDGYKLSKENIKKLCYAKDNEEFRRIIDKTSYSYIYQEDNTSVIEKREREYQKRYFSKLLKQNKMDFSVFMSYLILYRIEIRNIISIVEQKRYSL